MATWTLTAQVTGTPDFAVGATDRVQWCGSATDPTINIVVGSYQDGTHILNNTGEPGGHVAACTTGGHVNNTKYLTGTTMSLNGAGSANLSTLVTGDAPLKFNFSDAASVATSNGKFYAYDGTTDATPMAGTTFQAAEAVETTTWVAANGSAAALNLAANTAATSHDFFIATSVSPTSTGAKTGKIKISLTYV